MSNDSRLPPSDPQSDEPSVLDLFKSIFKDWDSFFNFLASVFDAARREQINRSLAEKQEVIVQPDLEPAQFVSQPGAKFPWRALLGLGFALFAQRVLEPPGRMLGYGIASYVIALGLIVWSYFADKWELSSIFPDHDRRDPETLRLLPLIIATVLAFVAFASFGGNLFKVGNVTLWLLAIVFFVYSLWLPFRRVHRERTTDERRRDMLWSLLILGVAALVIFFRVYQIHD